MDGRTLNILGALVDALHDRMADAGTQVSGLGASAPAALATLQACPGESVESLSRILGITNSGSVRLVDRLVSAGLVERRPGRDARSIAVHLTPAGSAVAAQVVSRRREALRHALAPLRPHEHAALDGMVERILDGLSSDRRSADRICRLCDYVICPQDRCPVERAVA
ncbi:MarR family winged helix-turn-helix transcriptional regulator [Micromonospora sp. 067-2]|uniref:MarR family winged helix-turn-helix transcriptional regulator n=1 Tax=Micromonospora sp. 067-2 TaxID=2789270 RepID=UPI00397C7C75